MVKKIVVLVNWKVRKPLLMAAFAHDVVVKMTGNTSFPSPPVVLLVLNGAATRVEVAYGNRKNGKAASLELKNASLALNTLLHELAAYVSTTSYNNEATILSAGFAATKNTRSKANVPATPVVPKIVSINGKVTMFTNKVPGATSYCWIIFMDEAQPVTITNAQISLVSPAKTILVPAGKTRELVYGIAPGTKVCVQVLAQNSAGKSAFTPCVSAYIS